MTETKNKLTEMKNKLTEMKKIVLFLMALTLCVGSVSAKVDKQKVTLYVPLHCQGCIDKVYKTIAFEQGVKDLQCDLEKQTVVVTYDANKTDVEKLQKAFAEIGKPASLTPPAGKTDSLNPVSVGMSIY